MKRFWAIVLSYLILLQGCASSGPIRMRDIPRGPAGCDAERAYREYAKTVDTPCHAYEWLNLGLLAFEAGHYFEAAGHLSRGEEFTHRQPSLFEKTTLHYYRGLAQLEQDNPRGAWQESEIIRAHLAAARLDSFSEESAFANWAAELLEAAADSSPPGDSARVFVICESGLMPRMHEQQIDVPIYASDNFNIRTDSTRLASGRHLHERWRHNRYYEDEPPIGMARVALPEFDVDPLRASDILSVEARWDSAGAATAQIVADGGILARNGLPDRQAMAFANAPIKWAQPPTYLPEDDGYAIAMGESEHRDKPDRPPEKREGRRETPDEKKDERKDEKKEAKKTEPKPESKPEEDDDDDGGGAAHIVGAIASVLVVGVFYLMYIGVKAAVTHGDAEDSPPTYPSWEMLPLRIHVAELRLAPGEHTIHALFEDEFGGTLQRHDFEPLTVKAGEVVVLRARSMK